MDRMPDTAGSTQSVGDTVSELRPCSPPIKDGDNRTRHFPAMQITAIKNSRGIRHHGNIVPLGHRLPIHTLYLILEGVCEHV